MNCPKGGDVTNDCASCIYSGEYHYNAEIDDCVRRKDDDFRKEAYHKGYLDALDYVAKAFSAIFDLPTKP